MLAGMPRVTLTATFGVGKEFSSRANWPEVLEVFRLPLGIQQASQTFDCGIISTNVVIETYLGTNSENKDCPQNGQ